MSGVVESMTGLPSDEGNVLYLSVRIDSGKKIRAYIPNSSFYRKGKKVKIEKQEPFFFGRPVYRFRGYVEEGAK